MSGDSYFRHKVVMEIGTMKQKDGDKEERTFRDDHELLDYLLEQEKLDMLSQKPGQELKPRY